MRKDLIEQGWTMKVIGPEERMFLLRYASWPRWKRWAWRHLGRDFT